MANVLTSFLIGIGLDTTEFTRGQQNVISGLESIKSKALMVGSAVLAGAFGLSKMGADFAETTDRLGKFGQTYSLVANDIAGFGRAIQSQGGDFEATFSQLEKIEKLRASYITGNVGWITPQAITGLDTASIKTSTDALQALLSQADRFKASTPQMRVNMKEALGIDDATARLLSLGREGASELIGKYKMMRPITDEATQASAEFNRQLLDLKTNMGAVSDSIAMKVIPVLNMAMKGWNQPAEEVAKGFNQNVLGKSVVGDVVRGAVGVISPSYEKELKKQVGVKDDKKTGNWYQRSIDWASKTYGGEGYSPSAAALPSMPTGPAVMPQQSAARQSAQTEALQKAQASRSQPQPPIIVHTHLNLDGREIDNRIVEVNQRGHKSTLDDVKSTTSR